MTRVQEATAERLERNVPRRVETAPCQLLEPPLGQVVGAEASDRKAVHLPLQLPRECAGREQSALSQLSLPLLVRDELALGEQLVLRNPKPTGLCGPMGKDALRPQSGGGGDGHPLPAGAGPPPGSLHVLPLGPPPAFPAT